MLTKYSVLYFVLRRASTREGATSSTSRSGLEPGRLAVAIVRVTLTDVVVDGSTDHEGLMRLFTTKGHVTDKQEYGERPQPETIRSSSVSVRRPIQDTSSTLSQAPVRPDGKVMAGGAEGP